MNSLEAERLMKIAKMENCDGEFMVYETTRWGPIHLAFKKQPDGSWKGIHAIFGVAEIMMATKDWSRDAFLGALIGDASTFALNANEKQLLGSGGILHG